MSPTRMSRQWLYDNVIVPKTNGFWTEGNQKSTTLGDDNYMVPTNKEVQDYLDFIWPEIKQQVDNDRSQGEILDCNFYSNKLWNRSVDYASSLKNEDNSPKYKDKWTLGIVRGFFWWMGDVPHQCNWVYTQEGFYLIEATECEYYDWDRNKKIIIYHMEA